MSWFLATIFISLAYCQTELPTFNWSSITPTPDLQYHDCLEVFRCARLQVPLDWSTPKATDKFAAIAIITLPATVPETDPSFGGTIIYNNGGPGQAGTDGVGLTMLPYLQELLAGTRNYELMSFDPRGVFRSTPSASCYETEIARLSSSITRFSLGRVAEGKNDLAEQLAFYKAESLLCEQRLADILPHISSASVARDMVEIIDRVELLRQQSNSGASNTSHELASKPKLQYVGPSYGSALGQYFAAMFPERVGRIYLDGVIDINDYSQGLQRSWFTDSEAALDDFFEQCFAVGSSKCPLVTSADLNATSIRTRVEQMIHEVDANSVPLIAGGSPMALTSDQIRLRILNPGTWIPISTYPTLATDLADYLQSNFTSLTGRLIGDVASLIEPILSIPPNDPYTIPDAYTWVLDAQIAITCLDYAAEASNRSLEYYNAYLGFVENLAPTTFNGINPTVMLGCAGRTIRPAYSFSGPFTFPVPGSGPNAAETGILFGTPRFDPGTPNAVPMSKFWPGSQALVQDGTGHCIIFNQPSECSRGIIRRYFETGKLPDSLTTCERQCTPWETCTPITTLDPIVSSG